MFSARLKAVLSRQSKDKTHPHVGRPPTTFDDAQQLFPSVFLRRLKLAVNSKFFSRYTAPANFFQMNPCRIAVGSTRRPKLQAVHEAAASFSSGLSPDGQLEIQGYEVESGVSHTPVSRQELMQG